VSAPSEVGRLVHQTRADDIVGLACETNTGITRDGAIIPRQALARIFPASANPNL